MANITSDKSGPSRIETLFRHKVVAGLKDFIANRRGGVSSLFAIGAVPFLCTVGASVDYGHAVAAKTAMQGALDATSLALAKQISSGQTPTSAPQFFSGVFARSEVKNVSVNSSVNSTSKGITVTVTASGSVETAFMKLFGLQKIDLQSKSVAYTATNMSGCVLALDEHASKAVSFGGNDDVELEDCSIYSNSDNNSSISVYGSAKLSALSVGTVGNASISARDVTLAEGVSSKLAPIRDPYDDLRVPSYGGCTQSKLNVKKTATLDPGVYCEGLTVNAGANVTLNPGVYYIDRGTLSINGGARISGQGVTLVFTSSTGSNTNGLRD